MLIYSAEPRSETREIGHETRCALFPTLVSHAPPLRSQLGLYNAIFQSLERPQLDSKGLRQSFNFILQLAIDPRPKVRKKAAEIVKDVLNTPPPPLLQHPYAQRVADWTISALSEVNSSAPVKFKGKKAETDNPDTAIHLLAFLRPVVPMLPAVVSALLCSQHTYTLIPPR